jgi:cytochrome bd-type quinol oxidase subunit 1
MAPLILTRVPQNQKISGNESAATHPSFGIIATIVVYCSLFILLGMMFYFMMMKLLRRIRETINRNGDANRKSETLVDETSESSR